MDRSVDWLRILLIAAAMFALICVGFFAAVVWQRSGSTQPIPQSGGQALTVDQRTTIVDQLNGNSTSTSTAAANAAVPSSQADQSDPNRAAKLQVLDSLNSK